MTSELNSTNDFFEAISVGDGIPVVIDFYANWCEPCKKFIRIWDRVVTSLLPSKIYKIDIDAHQEIASAFDVTKVPTFIYFKDGREVFRHENILTIKEMVEIISSLDSKNI